MPQRVKILFLFLSLKLLSGFKSLFESKKKLIFDEPLFSAYRKILLSSFEGANSKKVENYGLIF